MGGQRSLPAIIAALLLAGCASTANVDDDIRTGRPPICPGGGEIGPVLIAPQTHWRADQKERAKREAIAVAAIENAFQMMPCAKQVRHLPIGPESGRDELRAQAGDARTIIVIRIQELGPTLELSFPVLWKGYSDIKFDVVVIDPRSGAIRLDMKRHRKVGGAMAVRGVDPLQAEFETALKGVIGPTFTKN